MPIHNPFHYAVVVGINRYPGLEGRDLTCPKRDAERFAGWLRDTEKGGGLPEENVRLVVIDDPEDDEELDVFAAQPKPHEIYEELMRVHEAARKLKPTQWAQTRLYFFCSGHGIAPLPTEAALLAANAGPGRFSQNVSYRVLLDHYLKAQYFHELVFLADCCRDREPQALTVTPGWDEVEGNNGRVRELTGYACYFGFQAFEGEEPGGLSHFTRALLEALEEGQAARDGKIDSVDLADYLVDRVPLLSGKQLDPDGQPQKPHIPVDLGERILFRSGLTDEEVAAASTHEVTLVFAHPFEGEVVLQDGRLREVGRRPRGEGEWPVKLLNGQYRIRPADPAPANPFAAEGQFLVLGGSRRVEL